MEINEYIYNDGYATIIKKEAYTQLSAKQMKQLIDECKRQGIHAHHGCPSIIGLMERIEHLEKTRSF